MVAAHQAQAQLGDLCAGGELEARTQRADARIRLQHQVRELAVRCAGIDAQTGETMTAAVENALQERLERLLRDKDFSERKRRVRQIVKSFGPIPKGMTSDHSDLYDDDGLPA